MAAHLQPVKPNGHPPRPRRRKRRRAIKLHGFRVSDGGEGTIGRLDSELEAADFELRDAGYGRSSFARVRLCNSSIGRSIAGMCEPDDALFTHSNGAAIAMEAVRWSSCRLNLVLINPALDADTVFPDNVGFVHVYHNAGDSPVAWAKWLPFHPWGSMGRDGAVRPDNRITNFDTGGDWQVRAMGHSAIFGERELAFWGRFIVNRAVSALEGLPCLG